MSDDKYRVDDLPVYREDKCVWCKKKATRALMRYSEVEVAACSDHVSNLYKMLP